MTLTPQEWQTVRDVLMERELIDRAARTALAEIDSPEPVKELASHIALASIPYDSKFRPLPDDKWTHRKSVGVPIAAVIEKLDAGKPWEVSP